MRRAAGEPSEHDLHEAALLLLSLGEEAGGRIDPERINGRRDGSLSKRAFAVCNAEAWVNDAGWITATGREALIEWEREWA